MGAAGDPVLRTPAFWLIFTTSMLSGVGNTASTPLMAHYIEQRLGGDPATAALVISLAAFASIVTMPVIGFGGDRLGYRPVVLIGASVGVLGLALVALVPTVAGAGAGRIVFGLGNSAPGTLLITWIVAITPLAERGRALSVFGVSVWLGLALGPQVGETINARFGLEAVLGTSVAVEAVCVLLMALVPSPPRPPRPAGSTGRAGGPGLGATVRAVALPGVLAAVAWSGEGLLIGFLVVHLQGRGLPATGATSAATVYAAFAVTVIVARLALGQLPNRIGPVRTIAVSLCLLAGGLGTLAVAHGFPVAVLGAALAGAGYAPLYPALTMMASAGLSESNRGTGIGLFAACTTVGYGGGALLGGTLAQRWSTAVAFAAIAALQVSAFPVLLATRGGRRTASDPAATGFSVGEPGPDRLGEATPERAR
jgi:MFS family permease